jgi:HK97 family phage prohead protease
MRKEKVKMVKEYDFSGWATRNDVLCSDGRIIRKDAFLHNDGAKVPLMWGHQHNDPLRVLGHGILENREEGVYVYGKFNDSESGQAAKYAVEHGDVTALSIYANQLKQNGRDVMHGNIREVSLVVAGANPSAYIENVVRHSDDSEEDIIIHEEAVIYTGESIVLSHSEETVEHVEKEDKSVAEETKKETPENGKTVKDVFDEMTEEQQTVVYAMIGMALEENGAKADDEKENVEHSEGGTETMKTNVFDQTEVRETAVLTHADQMEIIATAKKASVGSLQEAIKMYMEENDTIAHGLDLGDADTLEELLPDHKLLNPGAPDMHGRPDQSWVMGVINKVKKSPIARVRTRYAEAAIAAFKAKGYKKGEEKKAQATYKLIGRKTEPTTIYMKEELNRDDIIDITDFDVVNYTWANMKDGMYETIALQTLVGDGREPGDEHDINDEAIRPIWKDEELYTHHVDVDIEKTRQEIQGTDTNKYFGENFIYAEAIVTAALYSRETFKGSGTPDLYCAPHLVNVLLLARDRDGHRIYNSKADLARALNVNSIVEIEQLAGLTRTDKDGKEKKLLGLFVNLADYQYGSTKGGELTKFEDFDIDFNKYKYLMETRLSGALVKLDSAIALEEPVESAAG